MENTSNIGVGIDIASEKFDVYLQKDAEKGIHKVFKNDEQGIQECIKFLKKHNFNGRIVMESTGRYHFLCAVMLCEANYYVSVINPLTAKKYQTSNIRKIKTDKTDAKLLAKVSIMEYKLPEFKKSRIYLVLRQKISLLKTIEKTLQELNASFKNHKETAEKLGFSITAAEKDLEKIIKELKKDKEKIEAEFIEIVIKEEGQEKFEIVNSIPGVSPYLSALMLYFYSFNSGAKVGQWIAFTGMDISILESGKWKGRSRLSKRGNKYLRKRGFSAAWGAKMNNEGFREYYDRLRDSGRSYVETMNIIYRKIIRIVFYLLKKNEFFDEKICFPSKSR